jgi:hypothetical protein
MEKFSNFKFFPHKFFTIFLFNSKSSVWLIVVAVYAINTFYIFNLEEVTFRCSKTSAN